MSNLALVNEDTQKDWASIALKQSMTLTVSNQQEYDNAAEYCKDIKTRIKQVEEYWKPLKEAATKQHKDICSKEKELLTPFKNAEDSIKGKMVTWQRQKLEEERILREEQERYRKEEEARLLALAVKAEEEGKEEHSEFLVEEAQKIHTAVFEQPEKVKTAGAAVKKTWKARIVNPELVPIEFAGAIIRPINESALDKLAKSSEGRFKIPGVEFYEDINIAISRG